MSLIEQRVMNAPSRGTLLAAARKRFQASCDIPTRFFAAEAETISQACLAMARRFHRGGRLLVFGTGSCVTDAQHVSVEFVHPVIVGKRALPAIALTNDMATTLGVARQMGQEQIFARQLQTLGRAEDIALGITTFGRDRATLNGLAAAREQGMLTIGLTGGRFKTAGESCDFRFVVPCDDELVIQETQETLYHLLWELVHVFFEHKGLLDEDFSRS